MQVDEQPLIVAGCGAVAGSELQKMATREAVTRIVSANRGMTLGQIRLGLVIRLLGSILVCEIQSRLVRAKLGMPGDHGIGSPCVSCRDGEGQ